MKRSRERLAGGSIKWPTQILALAVLLIAPNAYAQLIWSEEFNEGSMPNPETWSYDLGDWGWGNLELQNYTDSSRNVKIENGRLVITARVESGEGTDREFTSGRIRTQDKLTFQYGTLQARIKVPDLADGLWPAFWTLGNNFSTVGWPACGEMDVSEWGSSTAINQGVVNQRMGSAAHWDNSGGYRTSSRTLTVDERLDEGFHLYRLEWTPERITTFLDGEQVWSMVINPDSCASCSEFHQPHFIILNMAIGGTYTGLLNAGEITADMPARLLVDYVRIYDNGHTILGGSSLPEPPLPIADGYSGSWYNPDQSGHGFSMQFANAPNGTPRAVVYWYTYDSEGNPMFMVGTGVPTDDEVEITFQSPTGMSYGEFDPDSLVTEEGGSAVIRFNGSENMTFSYSPTGFSRTNWGHTAIDSLPLVRLFSVPYTPPATEISRP